ELALGGEVEEAEGGGPTVDPGVLAGGGEAEAEGLVEEGPQEHPADRDAGGGQHVAGLVGAGLVLDGQGELGELGVHVVRGGGAHGCSLGVAAAAAGGRDLMPTSIPMGAADHQGRGSRGRGTGDGPGSGPDPGRSACADRRGPSVSRPAAGPRRRVPTSPPTRAATPATTSSSGNST